MKYTLVKRGHPRYPERGKKVYDIKSVNVNWEPGEDFKNLKQKNIFREDLTRRMQKEALKADMEKWNKEEE